MGGRNHITVISSGFCSRAITPAVPMKVLYCLHRGTVAERAARHHRTPPNKACHPAMHVDVLGSSESCLDPSTIYSNNNIDQSKANNTSQVKEQSNYSINPSNNHPPCLPTQRKRRPVTVSHPFCLATSPNTHRLTNTRHLRPSSQGVRRLDRILAPEPRCFDQRHFRRRRFVRAPQGQPWSGYQPEHW